MTKGSEANVEKEASHGAEFELGDLDEFHSAD
jgi:hypothetical protein